MSDQDAGLVSEVSSDTLPEQVPPHYAVHCAQWVVQEDHVSVSVHRSVGSSYRVPLMFPNRQ